MEALQSEFWLTASPIAAPGTPLYVPSEDEIRRSSEGIADADKSRGQKRAAQNPLHRTA